MGVLDRFEKGVENAMQSAFAKTFKSGVKPVELAAAVSASATPGPRPLTAPARSPPTSTSCRSAPRTSRRSRSWGDEALAHELQDSLEEHARGLRYAFVGAVDVQFTEDESLATGRYAVTSATTRGPVAPATARNPLSRFPLLEIDGQRYNLTGATTVIGRGTEADIVVDDTGVSRTPHPLRGHARRHHPQRPRLNERHLRRGAAHHGGHALDGNAIRIGRTPIMYWDAVLCGRGG